LKILFQPVIFTALFFALGVIFIQVTWTTYLIAPSSSALHHLSPLQLPPPPFKHRRY